MRDQGCFEGDDTALFGERSRHLVADADQMLHKKSVVDMPGAKHPNGPPHAPGGAFRRP